MTSSSSFSSLPFNGSLPKALKRNASLAKICLFVRANPRAIKEEDVNLMLPIRYASSNKAYLVELYPDAVKVKDK